jgi:hypothetical protein
MDRLKKLTHMKQEKTLLERFTGRHPLLLWDMKVYKRETRPILS